MNLTIFPLPLRNFAALFGLLAGIHAATHAQTYTTTLTGQTVFNHFYATTDFKTEFPVGSTWNATLTWEPASAALGGNATQAQFDLTAFEVTIFGQTTNWVTSLAGDTASFSVLNRNDDAYHELQFTSGNQNIDLINGTTLGMSFFSLNIELGGSYANGPASLTTAPSLLDLSLYDLTNTNASQLKLYYGNSGGYVQGRITGFAAATGSPVPEPATYASFVALAGLALALNRRRPTHLGRA